MFTCRPGTVFQSKVCILSLFLPFSLSARFHRKCMDVRRSACTVAYSTVMEPSVEVAVAMESAQRTTLLGSPNITARHSRICKHHAIPSTAGEKVFLRTCLTSSICQEVAAPEGCQVRIAHSWRNTDGTSAPGKGVGGPAPSSTASEYDSASLPFWCTSVAVHDFAGPHLSPPRFAACFPDQPAGGAPAAHRP